MAVNTKALFSTLFLVFVQLFLVSIIEGNNNGFTIDLIHRDSPVSPYYNPSLSKSERLSKAFRRSFVRAASFKPSLQASSTIQSQVRANNGEYLMKVAVGTPPVEILSIADTGSDLAWFQCKPCPDCYEQKAPLFDPESSSTYKNLLCQSQYCEAVGTSTCASDNTCRYRVTYGDRSYSNGDLAVEKFTFGSISGQSVSIPKVVFGCGHDNNGTFNATGSGIVGLGGGALSIVNQLKKYINGKFSYCLVPIGTSPNVTSKLNFGSNAVVSGSQAVSTPLIPKTPDTYYYLTLEDISVGDQKLSYKNFSTSRPSDIEEGNIIIDSGTTLTLLPQELYQNLESTLEESIQGKRTSDSSGLFSLCYQRHDNIDFPKITFHFTDADVELKPSNTFLEVEDDVVCLTIIPSDELAIFGNLSQMDFLVGYDLVNQKVSFLPTDCTKQS